MTSLSVISNITSHDVESMLGNNYSSTTTSDYIGAEKRKVIADEIKKINPFSKSRSKIKLYDKSMGSPFSGMSLEKIDKFVNRNCGHFKKRKKIFM